MAKLGFKDIIMKYLKKDEAFKVKYAMNPNKDCCCYLQR